MKRFINFFGFFLSFCFLNSINLFALDPSKTLNQYIIRNWQIEDGLPQISVITINQSKDGYLWLGTEEGLVRFNGYDFKVYNKNTDNRLTNPYVLDLANFDNSILIGLFVGSLLQLKDGKIEEIENPDLKSLTSISVMKQDRKKGLWLGTLGKGLWYFKKNKLEEIEMPDLKEAINIRAIMEDKEGKIWIGTEGKGIYVYEDGKVSPFYYNKNLPDKNVFTLLQDRNGFYWIGTSKGLVKFSKENFQIFNEKNGLKNSNVRFLIQDREGVIWIGTNSGGIQRYYKNEFIIESQPSNLSKEIILSIFEDFDGNIWIGTMGSGLYQFSDCLIRTLGEEEGLKSTLAFSTLEDKKGDIWVGTSNGLFRYDRQKNKFFEFKDLPDNIVLGLLQDKKGGIYVGTFRGGIGYYYKNRWKYINIKNGLPSNKVFSLLEDSKERIWAGTELGIGVWDGKGWSVLDDKSGLPGKKVNAFLEDKYGRVWAGTNYGIGIVEEKEGKFYIKKFLEEKYITSFYLDAKGNLWIVTQADGIFLYRNGKIYSITTKDGLPQESVYKILEDDEGFLWLTSAKGLIRIYRKDLIDYFEKNNKEELNWFVFGKDDGMRSEECTGVCQPSGIKDKEGNLWIPTIKGIAFLNPKNVLSKPPEVKIYIEEIKVDKNVREAKNGCVFPPGRGEMEIKYSALFFSSPKSVEYRYRLVNFDKEWVYAGKRREAYYTNLPPKKYIFEVSARVRNYDFTETTRISFSLKPHFHQTWFFYAIILFLTIAILYGIFRLRINLLKARTAVLEERARISREIHDTLAQSFAAIVIQSEALRNIELEKKDDLQLRIDRIQELAKTGLQEARRSIKSMSSPVLQERSLPEAINYICKNMIGEGSIKFNLKIEGNPAKLSEKVEVNLLRIVQEAVSNALKHSKANQIEVFLKYSLRDVFLSISDNGIGFELEAPYLLKGDGLKNMQERAKELGAKFEIETKMGYGTKIIIKLKK